MENMKIYNEGRVVPQEAKKKIVGGRTKGFTNINPMWRIKKLTEMFGPCGLGWYFEIVNKEIIEGDSNEKIAIVDIKLFVKYGDEWSKAIAGTGGASFVAKERTGLYTSDECFKMAMTDAISVSCKNLGIGADVYYENDISKYDQKEKNSKKDPVKKDEKDIIANDIYNILITKNINTSVLTDYLKQNFGIDEFKQLNINQARQLKIAVSKW